MQGGLQFLHADVFPGQGQCVFREGLVIQADGGLVAG